MIKLWLSVSLVLVNVNACKVERCLMRHLLSAAPSGLCHAWLEFVLQSRSDATLKHSSTWDLVEHEGAEAWRRVRPVAYSTWLRRAAPQWEQALQCSFAACRKLSALGTGYIQQARWCFASWTVALAPTIVFNMINPPCQEPCNYVWRGECNRQKPLRS